MIQHLKQAILRRQSFHPTRRQFTYGALGAAIAAFLGYVFYEPRDWMSVGSLESIPTGTFLPFLKDEKHSAFIRRLKDGGIEALSQSCTHQGCRVKWNGPANEFQCPCHRGMFDVNGKPIFGPPVRPLERFETRVEAGVLQILI